MKSSPIVSIIIPVYNTPESYLLKSLQSVQEQDYKNIEVIIVDDGSDDGTAELIQNFVRQVNKDADDHKWKVITQKNKGLSAARNSGYELASGKYIQFLDSDDYFEKSLISSAVSQAEKTSSEIVVENFVVHDYDTGTEQLVLHEGNFPIRREVFKLTDLKSRRFETIPYSVWSKLFRKDFLDNNKLLHNENLLRAEDVLFSYTALVAAKRISVIFEPYIMYRENLPGSNTKTNDKFPSASVDAWKELHRILKKKNTYKFYKKDFEESMLGSISWHISRLHTTEGKRALAIATQDFMAAIGSSTMNEYTLVVAIASVDPQLLQLVEDKNNQISTMRKELDNLRNPGIRYSSRRLASAFWRRLKRSVYMKGENHDER